MATISKSLFGLPKGKVGDIIFRVRNGRLEFYTTPGTKVHKSKLVLDSNNKFAQCSPFCSALNKVQVLKKIWNESIPGQGQVFNKIMKVNLGRMKPGNDISGLLLTPECPKIEMHVTNVQLTVENMSVTACEYPEKIFGEQMISLQGVMQLTGAVDRHLQDVIYMPLFTKSIDLIAGSELQFKMKFDSAASFVIKEYSQRKLLVNFIVGNIQGIPLNISNEVYIEGI